MKDVKKLLICLLCLLMIQPSYVKADDTPGFSKVIATYNGETRDVLFEVMEVEGGLMTSLDFDVQMTGNTSGLTYKIFQYDGNTKQKYELASSTSSSFSMDASTLHNDIPAYLVVTDRNNKTYTKLLTIRVNKGKAQGKVMEEAASVYSENIEVDMSELLPGMKFQMHPYILPIIAKAYTDGRLVIGLGINSSDVSFWKSAFNGSIMKDADKKKLSDVFWRNTDKKSAVTGGNMGLIVEFSGWVQGNIYTNDPMKGELSLYIGSGFDITGQYLILTWEVTVTMGVDGALDFELRYNPEKDEYDEFHVDEFSISFRTGLEAYGGIGLSSLASVGGYGQGSIAVKDEFYPDPSVRSLVLAGEAGFKVKLLSRTIFSYAIVSGSHEFVEDKLSSDGVKNDSLLGISQINDISGRLLAANYGSVSGSINEPEDEGQWFTGLTAVNSSDGSLTEYETDPDFDHILATGIYPDNKLQVFNANDVDRQINVVFLGTDKTRTNGNRSRLMNFYYKEKTSYLSDPVWMFEDSDDYEYDDTADYDPYVYHSDKYDNTYIVWRNALINFDEDASFEDIVKNSDIYFASYKPGSGWGSVSRITDYGASKENYIFATGATVTELSNGEPAIAYYTSRVTDPAGIDETATRTVFVAYQNSTDWNHEKACEITGAINHVDTAFFKGMQCVAVSYTYDKDGEKLNRVEVWQRTGDKWSNIYNVDNAANARFINAGNGSKALTWYKEGRIYILLETGEARGLTSEDLKVPSSDYRIYGAYVTDHLAIVGNVSKEGSENAFALISNDGGAHWGKVTLTDIDENALVNEIGIAFTKEYKDDHSKDSEPIVFYSVQNYEVSDQIDMDYLKADADTILNSALKPKFEGLGSGLMIGQDDPRFSDTSTDLYVKARKANESFDITYVSFPDEDSARKGKTTTVEVEINNTGMYDLEKVRLYANGEDLGEHEIYVKAGNTATVKAEVLVPSDAPDEPLNYRIKAVTADGKYEDEYEAVLGTGNLAVQYVHELWYGDENIEHYVTNNGFAFKKVYIFLFDEDTGEKFYEYPLAVPAGTTMEGSASTYNGLFVQKGHENIRAYIVTEQERSKVPSDVTKDVFEETLQLDSTRSVLIKGLSEIYLQNVDNVFKSVAETKSDETDTPEKEEVIPVQPVIDDDDSKEEEQIIDEDPGKQEPEKDDQKKDDDKKDDGKKDDGKKDDDFCTVGGDCEQSTDPVDGKGDKNQGNWHWLRIAIPAAGGALLLLFLILLLLKRKKDEDE